MYLDTCTKMCVVRVREILHEVNAMRVLFVVISTLPAKNMLWRCVRESLAPIQERNQLGVIIVQFPRTFVHTEPSLFPPLSASCL